MLKYCDPKERCFRGDPNLVWREPKTIGNTQTKEGDLVTIRAKALCKSKPRKITQGHNTIHGITVKVGQKSIEEF